MRTPKLTECAPGTKLYDAIAALEQNESDILAAQEGAQTAATALEEAERKAYSSSTPAEERARLKMLLSELAADVRRAQTVIDSCTREQDRLTEKFKLVVAEAADLVKAIDDTSGMLTPNGYFDVGIAEAEKQLATWRADKQDAIDRLPRLRQQLADMVGDVGIEPPAERRVTVQQRMSGRTLATL